MPMDVQQRNGIMQVHVGPVERAILSAIFVGVTALIGWSWKQLNDLNDGLRDLVTKQAVANAQLDALRVQLADVPNITRALAELQVQVRRNSADIHDIREEKQSMTSRMR